MTRKEVIRRLWEIAYEIYNKLDEMEDLLGKLSPEDLEKIRIYWMALVNGTLLNLKGWMGGVSISLEDALTSILEEEKEKE